jgi:hypothetical protein
VKSIIGNMGRNSGNEVQKKNVWTKKCASPVISRKPYIRCARYDAFCKRVKTCQITYSNETLHAFL